MGEIRLDRYLSEMGAAGRSQIRDMARKGRILVNGIPEKHCGRKILAGEDRVFLDGREVVFAEYEYFLLNKPKGVVSAVKDNLYPTAVDLIGERKRRDLFPVGRLDLDTEGLLLITNDGDLAHRLLTPKKHVDKTYFALVRGPLPDGLEKQFGEGMVLSDKTALKPAGLLRVTVDQAGDANTGTGRLAGLRLPAPDAGQEAVLVTIREGKFHQIKRMFEAAGSRVEYLKRISMGPLKLDGGLLPGQYRPLTEEELGSLKEISG